MVKAPLVVGYKGEIGRFILLGLLEDMPKANDIFCVDVNNSDDDVLERIEKSDTIFLCVPLQATATWLRKFRPALKGRIIAEQSSIKSFLYEDPEFADLRFLSMHLLFRPSATPVENRSGMVFSDRMPKAQVKAFGEQIGRALRTNLEFLQARRGPTYVRHDQMMARQQALVHRVLLSLADSLEDAGSLNYIGQRVCELATRLRQGDPTLYRMIQNNPHLEAEMEAFHKRLDCFPVDHPLRRIRAKPPQKKGRR